MTSFEQAFLDVLREIHVELSGIREGLMASASALMAPPICSHPLDRREDLTIRKDQPIWRCLDCGFREPLEDKRTP